MNAVASARVAIVTGGASGVGLGIVRHLAGEGMAVVAIDWDADACIRAQTDFAANDGVRFVRGDVGTLEGACLAIDTAIEAFGRLGLLCNNAALIKFATIEDVAFDVWREMFRVNVDGPMLRSSRALPHMRRQDPARS